MFQKDWKNSAASMHSVFKNKATVYSSVSISDLKYQLNPPGSALSQND